MKLVRLFILSLFVLSLANCGHFHHKGSCDCKKESCSKQDGSCPMKKGEKGADCNEEGCKMHKQKPAHNHSGKPCKEGNCDLNKSA
ncbi:MAG: hypothetical protein KDD61_08620 [Bdellovibrionales bacterium]|nr:hypothetical protein [Bdellovibrionales bacterium]